MKTRWFSVTQPTEDLRTRRRICQQFGTSAGNPRRASGPPCCDGRASPPPRLPGRMFFDVSGDVHVDVTLFLNGDWTIFSQPKLGLVSFIDAKLVELSTETVSFCLDIVRLDYEPRGFNAQSEEWTMIRHRINNGYSHGYNGIRYCMIFHQWYIFFKYSI